MRFAPLKLSTLVSETCARGCQNRAASIWRPSSCLPLLRAKKESLCCSWMLRRKINLLCYITSGLKLEEITLFGKDSSLLTNPVASSPQPLGLASICLWCHNLTQLSTQGLQPILGKHTCLALCSCASGACSDSFVSPRACAHDFDPTEILEIRNHDESGSHRVDGKINHVLGS